MVEGEQGMVEKQAGTGVPHHFPDALTHNRLVAMYRAMAACRLLFTVRTFVEACSGVGHKGFAFRTEVFFCFVPVPAPQADHCLAGLEFPL